MSFMFNKIIDSFEIITLCLIKVNYWDDALPLMFANANQPCNWIGCYLCLIYQSGRIAKGAWIVDENK